VTFDHFWYRGETGPLLEAKYPALASRMYGENCRQIMHSPSSLIPDDIDRDIKTILALAKDAPPSRYLRKSKSRSEVYSCRANKLFPIRSPCRTKSGCLRSATPRSTSPSYRSSNRKEPR
jgi:hypothetical protein